jgi:Mn-containing catalase
MHLNIAVGGEQYYQHASPSACPLPAFSVVIIALTYSGTIFLRISVNLKSTRMFYHVKELQFNARVSRPDPAFATLLLEQFGGANGELAAALRYFSQAFGAKKPFPDKYDLLMDIALEEFSHLEIVGATIQMLLTGVNSDLKDAAEESEIMKMMNGNGAKEELIHQSLFAPQFLVSTGGGPAQTNSQGVPFTAAYINGDATGELTADLRSNMGAESRAKMVYEYLLQYTNDPFVKETLHFLMAREVAHYQQFEAALDTIRPNFPPGTLQSDARYSNLYFDLSNGEDSKQPWNSGKSSQLGEQWHLIEDPLATIKETDGLVNLKPNGTHRTPESIDKMDKSQGKERSETVKNAVSSTGPWQWHSYSETKTASK